MKQSCQHVSTFICHYLSMCQCHTLGTKVVPLQSSGFPMVPMSLSSIKRNLAIELTQATESSAPSPWHPRLPRMSYGVWDVWARSKSTSGEDAKNRSIVISFHITSLQDDIGRGTVGMFKQLMSEGPGAKATAVTTATHITCAHAKERQMPLGLCRRAPMQ